MKIRMEHLMKTQAPAPIKTIYYTDERNDEFSSAKIETRRIDESYRYIDPPPRVEGGKIHRLPPVCHARGIPVLQAGAPRAL